MPQPNRDSRGVRLAVLAALGLSAPACFANPPALAAGGTRRQLPPEPETVVSLAQFGYRPAVSAMLTDAGYASVTVNYLDSEDVLVTFIARKLVPRLPDAREGDQDCIVHAAVLHLPDAAVIRETDWHMRDHGQYLWPLSHGRFLLRERNTLYTIEPLRKDGHGLERQPFLAPQGELASIQLSPSADLILVETTPEHHVGDDAAAVKDGPVSASFYSVEEKDGRIYARTRGHAKADEAFGISFTSAGVLRPVQEDSAHWGFDFHSFDGKVLQLAGLTSTCRPSSFFVTDDFFFSAGCHGGSDRRLLAGFNLLAEANWVFTTDDPPTWTVVSTSPETGRFAVRNTLVQNYWADETKLMAEDLRGQEVRVYGERNGDELLHVSVSPTQRTGSNFSLSPDGMHLAVLNGRELEIYKLPPVSDADQKFLVHEHTVLQQLKNSRSADVVSALNTE